MPTSYLGGGHDADSMCISYESLEERVARQYREYTEREETPCCTICHEPLSPEEIGDEQDSHEACNARQNAYDRMKDALDTLYRDALEAIVEYEDEERKGYFRNAPDLGVNALVARLREVMYHATVSKKVTPGLTSTLAAMVASDGAR